MNEAKPPGGPPWLFYLTLIAGVAAFVAAAWVLFVADQPLGAKLLAASMLGLVGLRIVWRARWRFRVQVRRKDAPAVDGSPFHLAMQPSTDIDMNSTDAPIR